MKRILMLLITIIGCIYQNAYAQKPLKILFMLNCFPALSATFVMGQITGLIERGHDVSIFAYRKIIETKNHQDIHRYNLLEKTYFKDLPHNIMEYDVLYCQFFSTAKQFLPEFIRLKKRSKNIPKMVVCCRGNDGIEHVRRNDKKIQELFAHVDLFLPVCEHFKKYLLKAGCDDKKVLVHHSAIDLSKFRYKEPEILSDDQEVLLLSIGRLVEEKGFEYSIRAFAQLEKEYPQLRYAIIGDGALRGKLERIIKEYNLTSKIRLLGWCTQDEIIGWLHKAHIFVHPAVKSLKGYEEGIPNVLMEALASGIPVVSTNTGGTGELIRDTLSGFMVPERDAQEIAHKINLLIENPLDGQTISVMGRIVVEQQHNIEKKNDSLEKKIYMLIESL